MMGSSREPALRDPLIDLAERVAGMAADLDIQTALIGGMALAVHNYVRGTDHVDLAAAVDPFKALRMLRQQLDAEGLRTELDLPDANDPLGGVLRVRAHANDDPVDIVNFLNPLRPLPNPGQEAIQTAPLIGGSKSLRCATLPHIIALKLYAGGRRDHADVVELLRRNPAADRGLIRGVCINYGSVQVLEELIREA